MYAIAQKEQLGFDKAVEVHHVAPQTTTITTHTHTHTHTHLSLS